MASSATGTFTHCGPGQYFALDFTCTGPSCSALNGFPNTTCTTSGGSVLTCTNGVTCTGPTNYTSEFDFSQKDVIVSQTQKVKIDCGEFELTSDGTTGGTKFKVLDTKDCASNSDGKSGGPSSSLPISSSTSYLNGTTAVSATGSKSSSVLASNGFPAPYPNGTGTAPTAGLKPTVLPSHNGHPGYYSNETANPSLTEVEQAESTLYSTAEVTITNCDSTVTNCPAHIKTLIPVALTPGASGTSSSPSELVESPESTFYSTAKVTVTSCDSTVTNCPAHTKTLIPVALTPKASVISSSPSEPVESPGSTFYSTAEVTVTSCDSTVINCPAHTKTLIPVALTPEASGTYSSPSEPVESHVHELPTASVPGQVGAFSSVPEGPSVSYPHEPATAPYPLSFLETSTPLASTYQNGTATAFTSSLSTRKPLTFTGGASSRHSTRPAILCVFLLVISFLVQSAAAFSFQDDAVAPVLIDRSPAVNVDQSVTTYSELQSREVNKFFKTFADLLSEYLANKLTAAGGKGDLFADNLVAEVEEAVCDHFVNGAITTLALGTLLEDCVAAVYAGNLLIAPEFEFLSVFGAGLLCNYAINELVPQIGELTDAVCKDKKTCGNLLTDPKNCGACGNVCATGVCAQGACTSNACKGETCDTFGPCGPGGDCVCASTAEGTGYCVDGSTQCEGLDTCSDSADCASGLICAVATCCPNSVCVGATFCGSSNSSPSRLFRRDWANATIASPGVWVN